MKILRNTDEWVGLLVVVSVVLFVAAALHIGGLSGWFRPVVKLQVVLPEGGGQGLAAGSDIEVLGTKVGSVKRIVVGANQKIYADAELEEQAKGFVRRDSTAVIKKSFGIVGAALLDISRGSGAEMDWHHAVIEATAERAPTENIGAMIDEVKKKVYPALDDLGRTIKAAAEIVERINRGEGNVGRLLKDDAIAVKTEEIVANVKIMSDELKAELAAIRGLTDKVTRPDGVPALLKRIDATMASVQKAAHDLAETTPHAPTIARNVAGGTANLPALLTQTAQTLVELEKLATQLRHTWPLSGAAAPESRRLPPGDVKP